LSDTTTDEHTALCAAPGCDEVVVRSGRGRPRLYCSPTCRPAARGRAGVHVIVEVDHAPTPDNERPTGRVWLVRMRRGPRSVVIAAELGRPSADHLAGQLNELLATRGRAKGVAME
jgi:hypothetical protein